MDMSALSAVRPPAPPRLASAPHSFFCKRIGRISVDPTSDCFYSAKIIELEYRCVGGAAETTQVPLVGARGLIDLYGADHACQTRYGIGGATSGCVT
ncbi:hypothetical protein EVAR_15050_1 [Eumeta japonica]|uniref:Uncharacterized protein n=1 Tax=Eumeta variegata TaxID=151549 RepID=A0A4C1X5K8_EUMVA|nr:hypothetical protein EVAR_15050_1 [Eumeta japonica]